MTGIMGTTLADDKHWSKTLFYGDPGSGKTTNIASMANIGPMVAVDLEGGWEKPALDLRGINTSNIHIFRPTNFDEMEQVFYEVKNMIDTIGLIGVGFDHTAEAQNVMLRDAAIARVEKDKKALFPKIATSPEAKAEYDSLNAYTTDRRDYGEMTERGKRLVRNFRSLPCHVAFASHETRNDSGKIIPLQSDKFGKYIMGGVRTIIYTRCTYIKAEDRFEYTGVTKPIDQFQCKDNTGKLPVVMVDPTMERVIKVISGELDLSTDPAQQAYEARKRK